MEKDPSVQNYRWNLARFYSGIDDPQLAKDLRAYEAMAQGFHFVYLGKVAADLPAALREYANLSELASKFGFFLGLARAQNMTDEAIKTAGTKAEEMTSRVAGEYLEFFSHELAHLTDAELAVHAEHPYVKQHLPLIQHARAEARHLLSLPVEEALTKRSPYGADAWADFFDEADSDLRFRFAETEGTEPQELTREEIVSVLTESTDPKVRARALKVLNDGLGGSFAKLSAQALNMIVGDKRVEDRERGYQHPMEDRNFSNRIPDSVVEALHLAVNSASPALTARFYRLKARLLGLEMPLGWGDRNAKLPLHEAAGVPFDQAAQMVSRSYHSFSPTLGGLVDEMLATGCVDAPATKGKTGGAFNYSVVMPGGAPVSYTLLNYLGSLRDVGTLAHELGHGVHGRLAGVAQGVLQAHAPMAYCETASIFGERVTFDALKAELLARGDKEGLLQLVMSAIDDGLNSVTRQISFSNFERAVHGAGRRLSPQELNDIWLRVTRELYGADGDVFSYENIGNLWTYVGHFHRPFYVYSYAFGHLLTNALMSQRERLGERFEPLYLDLLRAGSTRDVFGLLAPFGLDPADPGFWSMAIDAAFSGLLTEAEALVAERLSLAK